MHMGVVNVAERRYKTHRLYTFDILLMLFTGVKW